VDQRFEQLKVWLQQSGTQFDSITPASADASFRRYFRITSEVDDIPGKTQTRIVMDAPPDKEDCRPFIKIATMLFELGLNVPQILKQDLQQGFLLLSDLGDTVFLSVLNNDTVDDLYHAAMKSLLIMQQKQNADLPLYSETLLRNELALFPDWYLAKQLNITLTAEQTTVLENTFDILVNNALTQPQVCVHRDYHSRNLMINEQQPDKPGIIDFQDAVIGAVTYDLVSLLKDCYISWPRQKVEAWVKSFQQQAESLGIIKNVSTEEFMRWFDLMGLQRHIKVAGIFSRLKHRDGKTGYLKDIPRTMDYVFDVIARYPEFKPMQTLLDELL
jgi:aminoglycoside/choline kinase family phosphotransferase